MNANTIHKLLVGMRGKGCSGVVVAIVWLNIKGWLELSKYPNDVHLNFLQLTRDL